MAERNLSGRTIITGTSRWALLDSGHYRRETEYGTYIEDWQAITVRQLVELYLEDERGFTLSQYRVFFAEAKSFLGDVTYPTNEHRSLLRTAFVKYLNR